MSTVEVEFVEGGEHALGEAGEAAAQPVLGCEFGASVGELGVFGGVLVAPCGERGGAVGELVEVQQRGLVGVQQPSAFGLGLIEFALQRGELGCDELVVVGRGRGDDGALAGEQLGWLE